MLRSYHVGEDEGDGVVPGNDVKMVSVKIPTLLGPLSEGRKITNTDRTFGMSDHCRALFNDTSGSKIFMYEL